MFPPCAHLHVFSSLYQNSRRPASLLTASHHTAVYTTRQPPNTTSPHPPNPSQNSPSRPNKPIPVPSPTPLKYPTQKPRPRSLPTHHSFPTTASLPPTTQTDPAQSNHNCSSTPTYILTRSHFFQIYKQDPDGIYFHFVTEERFFLFFTSQKPLNSKVIQIFHIIVYGYTWSIVPHRTYL